MLNKSPPLTVPLLKTKKQSFLKTFMRYCVPYSWTVLHIFRIIISNCMFFSYSVWACWSRVCVCNIWSDCWCKSPEPCRSVSIMLICLEMNTDISGPAAAPLHIHTHVLIARSTCKSLQRRFAWLHPAVTKMRSAFTSHHIRAGCALCLCFWGSQSSGL